ncbi:MAG TPA: hypothetical protein VFA98_07535 [Thermoanaerobaculia bacterium]|jgi:hypothetical protein|nr:hypothetical protein [Thermoanaerobaculia bacterium]
MDYTGARRYGSDEAEEGFYKEIALWLIGKVQPEIRFHPITHEEEEPNRHAVVKNWRQAGYALGRHLVPRRRGKRFPIELESFVAGLRMFQEDYERELGPKVEAFDVDASEREEAKAEKFLRLATHEGTPIDEARAAALALARMIGSADLVLLSRERVRHFASYFRRMEDLFEVLRRENPTLFFYGAREQLGRRFMSIVDDEFGQTPWR